MNIVQVIKVQVTGPVLRQLSSAVGMSESTTRSAVGATVPSLLSSFSSMVSSGVGAQKLVGALERFDPQSSGSLSGLLNERPDVLVEKGTGMAESLIGSGGVSGIVGSLSRSYGFGSASANKLLGFLTPTVLGGIALQFSGKTLNASTLSSFFSDQKRHISHGIPAGFAGAESVASEGMGKMKEEVKAFGRSVQPRSKWVLPVALALGAIALVMFFNRTRPSTPVRSDAPDASTRLGEDFRMTVGSLTATLSGVKDEATAEAALPKLAEAKGKLEEIRASASQLPQDGKAKFDEIAKPQIEILQSESMRVASIPGAADKVKPALDDLIVKLNAPLGGAPAEDVK